MTLYSQIKQYLDYGLMVVVETIPERYRIFHRVLPDGYLELTYAEKTIEQSLISGSEMLDESEINKLGWRIHSLLPRPITPYPVGMKVRVSEEYSKCSEALVDIVELAKHKVVVTIDAVKEYTYGSLVYEFSYKNYVWYIDHRFLIPVLEEERKEIITKKMEKEDWMMIGRKNGWIKGGEVIE